MKAIDEKASVTACLAIDSKHNPDREPSNAISQRHTVSRFDDEVYVILPVTLRLPAGAATLATPTRWHWQRQLPLPIGRHLNRRMLSARVTRGCVSRADLESADVVGRLSAGNPLSVSDRS